jgi:hypothetical protein
VVFLCFLLCLWRGKKPEDTTGTAKEVRDKKNKKRNQKGKTSPKNIIFFLFFAKQSKLQERGENLNIFCFLEAQTRPAFAN